MQTNNPDISIVIPVYGCSTCLIELNNRLTEILCQISENYEIIFVNDASPDNSWEIIKKLAENNNKIRGINLLRNFGQQNAILAGLSYTIGKATIVMDCDLQDQPEEIINLYNTYKQGFDFVLGRRINREDNFIRKFSSKLFYKIFNFFTGNISDYTTSNFGIYSNNVIENYKLLPEKIKLLPLMAKMQGFKVGFVNVIHSKRKTGKSSYNTYKLLSFAFNIFISHTNKPLKLFIKLGFLLSLFSGIYLFYLIFRKLYLDIPIGWTSIMVSIFFIGGLLFANLGIIGLYIGKIYDEVKNRPLFTVKETT